MAVGEYVSVASQGDLARAEIEVERHELRVERGSRAGRTGRALHVPRGRPRTRPRGLEAALARPRPGARDPHPRRTRRLTPTTCPRPILAAGSSFVSFSIGAALPVLPFMLGASALWPAAIVAASPCSSPARRGPHHRAAALVRRLAAARARCDRGRCHLRRRCGHRHPHQLTGVFWARLRLAHALICGRSQGQCRPCAVGKPAWRRRENDVPADGSTLSEQPALNGVPANRVPAKGAATAVPSYFAGPAPVRVACTTQHSSTTPAASRSSPTLPVGRSHDVVANALTALRNLEHRGATGREIDTGDGAGLLTQIPDEFFRAVVGFELPPAGSYAVGIVFLPTDDEAAAAAVASASSASSPKRDLRLLGWRELPVVPDIAGPSARAMMPRFRQLFVAPIDAAVADLALERWSIAPASGSSTRSRSTSRRCRRARSSTRACSRRRSSSRSFPTCPTNGSPRHSRSCTRGSRRTRSRAGRSRIPTASSRTTVRSTPSRATATGCAPAKACSRAT